VPDSAQCFRRRSHNRELVSDALRVRNRMVCSSCRWARSDNVLEHKDKGCQCSWWRRRCLWECHSSRFCPVQTGALTALWFANLLFAILATALASHRCTLNTSHWWGWLQQAEAFAIITIGWARKLIHCNGTGIIVIGVSQMCYTVNEKGPTSSRHRCTFSDLARHRIHLTLFRGRCCCCLRLHQSAQKKCFW